MRRATDQYSAVYVDVAISIHALREEGDTFVDKEFSAVWIFLSTPSVRRATIPPSTADFHNLYFYPRPP